MLMVCGRPQDGEGVQVHVDACGQREEWTKTFNSFVKTTTETITNLGFKNKNILCINGKNTTSVKSSFLKAI